MYPAGTKNSTTKQIKPTPNKTSCAILKANISLSICIEYRVSMYQSQETEQIQKKRRDDMCLRGNLS